MSMTKTRPSRLALSHCMIWGGTKPMTPTRRRRGIPPSSMKSRSRITYGWIRGGAEGLADERRRPGEAEGDVALVAVVVVVDDVRVNVRRRQEAQAQRRVLRLRRQPGKSRQQEQDHGDGRSHATDMTGHREPPVELNPPHGHLDGGWLAGVYPNVTTGTSTARGTATSRGPPTTGRICTLTVWL